MEEALGLTYSEGLIIKSFAVPAARCSGLMVGDRIMALNGVSVETQEDFVKELGLARRHCDLSGESLHFSVLRGGVVADTCQTLAGSPESGDSLT